MSRLAKGGRTGTASRDDEACARGGGSAPQATRHDSAAKTAQIRTHFMTRPL